MYRKITILAAALFLLQAAGPGVAQAPIEEELNLITPVAKTLTDPTLADFAKYAKEKWNVTVKTSALAAGTPVATALARAQREARRVDSSPLRWAPFAVVGDPGWRLHGTAEAVEPCA